MSYHFARSTYNYNNIAVAKAAFTDAWAPTEEQIGDAHRVQEWLTDTLTAIVENPLLDGHARVLTAHVRLRAEAGDGTSACSAGANFTADADGAYRGFDMPCDAAKERAKIDAAALGFKSGTVVEYACDDVTWCAPLPQMLGHYFMMYHAGLNDTREAIEQIGRLRRALPQLQPLQTLLAVCTVSPGVSGGTASGCDNQFSLLVDREAGTGRHTVQMIQLTTYPEGWPGPWVVLQAVLILAIVVWELIREAREVRRRQDYMRRTSVDEEGVSLRRALWRHVCAPDNFVDIFVLVWTAVWVLHSLIAAFMPRPTVPPPAASPDITTNVQGWWKLATWMTASLRFEPDDNVAYRGDSPMMGSAWTHLTLGIAVSVTSYRLMYSMRWHFGVSSILNTIMLGWTPLVDTLWAMFSLLLSTALGLALVFGAAIGDPNYASVSTSLLQTALMAFGYLDYSDVASQGYGASHDGLGAGPFAFTLPLVFWVMFFLLQIISSNILIAVTGDGYEQHVDAVGRQIGSDGRSFVRLAWRLVRLRLWYQPRVLWRHAEDADTWGNHTSTWPAWARRMHLADDPQLGALIDAVRLPSGVDGHIELFPAPSIKRLCDTLLTDHTIRPNIKRAEKDANDAIGEDDAEKITYEAYADAMMTHVIIPNMECTTIAPVLRGIRDTFEVNRPSDAQLSQLAEKIVLAYGQDGATKTKKGNVLRRTVTEVVRKELQAEMLELKAENARLSEKMDALRVDMRQLLAAIKK